MTQSRFSGKMADWFIEKLIRLGGEESKRNTVNVILFLLGEYGSRGLKELPNNLDEKLEYIDSRLHLTNHNYKSLRLPALCAYRIYQHFDRNIENLFFNYRGVDLDQRIYNSLPSWIRYDKHTLNYDLYWLIHLISSNNEDQFISWERRHPDRPNVENEEKVPEMADEAVIAMAPENGENRVASK